MLDTINLEQGSEEWKLARLGHVTASNVADVMAKGKSGEAISRKKLPQQKLAEQQSLVGLELQHSEQNNLLVMA